MDKEKIREQAKRIMDDFIKALGKLEEKEFAIERKSSLREQNKCEVDKDFNVLWYKNLPKKKNGYMVAEKGHWK